MNTMQAGNHTNPGGKIAALIVMVLALVASPAAFAVVKEIAVTGTGDELASIPSSGLVFETESGDVLPAEKSEDEEGGTVILVDFTGHRDSSGRSPAGTLVIGDRRIAVPSAGSIERIVVDLSDLDAHTTLGLRDAAEPVAMGWHISVAGGVGSADVTQVGAGTDITSSGESSVAAGSDSIDLTGYDVKLGYGRYTLQIGSASGSETSNGTIVPGTTDVGIVYPRELQLEGGGTSTGVFLGMTGLDAITDVDYDERFARLELALNAVRWSSGVVMKPYVSFAYQSIDQDYSSQVASPLFSGIFQNADQSLEYSYASLGLGARVRAPIGESGNWFWGFDADVDVGRYDARLDSVHVGGCDLCLDPAEQNYTMQINQDDSDFAYNVGAQLVFGLSLAPGKSASNRSRADLELYAGIDYRSDFPGIWNPVSGDDLFIDNRPTEIVYDTQTQYTVGLRFIYRF